MPVSGMNQTSTFHNSKRREVVASADVAIRQVQIVDKKGQVRALIVWQCGPDVLYSDSMDGLFDATRRKKAPEWVVDQLSALTPDRCFDASGNPYGDAPVVDEDESHIPAAEDDDLPAFVQG